MSKKQEETQIRNDIMEWFSYQPNTLMLVFYNGAIYDPALKMFRNPGKWHRPGTVDLIGTWKGLPLGVEVKRPGEDPKSHQLDFHKEARSKGWIIIVAECWQDVSKALQEYETKK